MQQAELFHQRRALSFRYGLRPARLQRDGRRCRGCGSRHRLCVHHRRYVNRLRWLVTVCRTCHARLHKRPVWSELYPAALYPLWREWHPAAPVQRALPLAA